MASRWTPTTLATHVFGVIQGNVNSDDSPPNRLIELAQEAYREVWHAHEWTIRYSTTTETWEPGEGTVAKLDAAPSVADAANPTWDEKFDAGWILLTQAKAELQFRNDSKWNETQQGYEQWLAKARIEDDREYWTDTLAGDDYNLWSLQGMTRQICFEIFQGQLDAEAKVASKRTLLMAVANTVQHAYLQIWEAHPWRFRKKRSTLTTVASTSTLALPSDFGASDARWIEEEDQEWRAKLTTDVEEFEDHRRDWGTDAGDPDLALIEYDTDNDQWQLRFSPTPESADSFVLVYTASAAVLAAADSPDWPTSFHKGWFAGSRMEAHRRFGLSHRAQEAEDEFREWLRDAIAEHDQKLTQPQLIERDGYGDFAAYDPASSRELPTSE